MVERGAYDTAGRIPCCSAQWAMISPTVSHHQRLARQAMELSLAAPHVVAHRMARMAVAGPAPSARDRQEFWRMGNEKVVAFQQSWMAMWMQAWQIQLQLARSFTMATTQALARGDAAAWAPLFDSATTGATSLLTAGLAPVHRRAVANSRRLARSRR